MVGTQSIDGPAYYSAKASHYLFHTTYATIFLPGSGYGKGAACFWPASRPSISWIILMYTWAALEDGSRSYSRLWIRHRPSQANVRSTPCDR